MPAIGKTPGSSPAQERPSRGAPPPGTRWNPPGSVGFSKTPEAGSAENVKQVTVSDD